MNQDIIIQKRAAKYLYFVCLAAIPLWLLWIVFDYLYAFELWLDFLPLRLIGSFISLLIAWRIRKREHSLHVMQLLMFIYYNISIGIMMASVPASALSIYFTGYSMVIIVMYFILILNRKQLILFSLTVFASIVGIILYGNHSMYILFGNGGFAFITIWVLMNFIGYSRYNGVLRDISLLAEIEKAKENQELIVLLKAANEEKATLLKEIHHRVKNNLQIVSSILNLQRSYVDDDKTLLVLKESQDRIRSMAAIHENLYKSKDLSSINLANYVPKLVGELIDSYSQVTPKQITFIGDIVDLNLEIDKAIPCGLIINELVTNSIKHAFKTTSHPIISIHVEQTNNQITIHFSDNGQGMAENIIGEELNSLGLTLIHSLVEQIDGELSTFNENGAHFIIRFNVLN